ncbi:DUF2231 domain-containing protein [uncultured Phenylobacterium sp.]|uniref:DUF2231 domain-containing protein n=1 Tax=uncultured Phenylobacterium sp. TaxID=349273 RepID=UPI0025E40684|nr:DUF2231 domain-containing protein [uncultured Phenylobacterium sp.]
MHGSSRPPRSVLKAGNRLLLAFPIALFVFALATDITYLRTAELQWTNFSAWSIAIALVSGALALAFALVGALFSFRSRRRGPRLLYAAALAVMCILGLINAFKHSQDGWSSVGFFGVVLSALTAGAALLAGVIAYSGALDERAA